jgi:hypothetical protein
MRDVPGYRGHLRDAMAHRPGADNGDRAYWRFVICDS